MKVFFWTALAVVAGMFLYGKLTGRNPRLLTGSKGARDDRYVGPDVDPKTGAYLPPDAKVGTVQFPAQGN